VSRPVVLGLYALLVVIWSSTWVAIAIGLDDTPPLFGAGLRFALAGAGLLLLTRALRRPLRSDARLVATLALLPFAMSYGLIYWAEQYIPSGLTAVLFGVMPLYVAGLAMVFLHDEPVTGRFVGGVAIALGGLVLAFGESLALGSEEHAALAAAAVLASPLCSAIGNLSIKRRAGTLDALPLNGWAMLGGGVALLAASATGEDWGAADWTAEAVGSLLYLAVFGTALTFVVLTRLLRELSTLAVSYLPLILPFGALLFGAALNDEELTAPAIAGAALVAAGLAVAQWRPRRASGGADGADLVRLAPPPGRGRDAHVDEQAGEADAQRHDRLRGHG
jgi:drug/metabolite transporter (DMT)-like permease